MKTFTKKCTALYCLFLLMASYTLYAAKSMYQPRSAQTQKAAYRDVPSSKRKLFVYGYCRTYVIPTDLCFFIRCLVYDNPFKYRNKPLPNDLSEKDLSGFDFTGCAFTYTNLIDTNLAGVILTNTTCNYQAAFQKNITKNKIYDGTCYHKHLPKDLQSIAEVYPKVNDNIHKAKLLKIASAFSQLPFYERKEFYIKVQYWSCALLHLKQALGNPYGHQLVCSLEEDFREDANNYCWTTNYPQDRVDIATRAPHTNFETYLNEFNNGLKTYQCKSKENSGFSYYKKHIIKSIEGLATTYPMLRDKQLQQTACAIAHALSKSYQIQNWALFSHYLFCQDRLIWLKKLVGVGVKNKIYYSQY